MENEGLTTKPEVDWDAVKRDVHADWIRSEVNTLNEVLRNAKKYGLTARLVIHKANGETISTAGDVDSLRVHVGYNDGVVWQSIPVPSRPQSEASLKEDGDAELGAPREYPWCKLTLNGGEVRTWRTYVSYEHLVEKWTGYSVASVPSVTYRTADNSRSGILAPGQTLELADGMVIDAIPTGNA